MKNSIYISLIIALSWGCANKVQPTGGPKDEEPPELLRSNPEIGQRNYKEQTISLEFNEYIQFKGLREQLLITPRVDAEYEFKIRKRTAFLEFDQPFADSTTYTFNFREAVVDLTEGNPAKNLLLAFSTGNLLDTLELSGTILDALTQIPVEEATVALFDINDTLDIFTGPPYYLTQTNKEGNYSFKNLKDGTYRVYAFQDINKNLTCQSDAENYGFIPEPIVLDTIVTADTINFIHLNIDTLKLLRTRPSGKYYIISANKYLTNAHLKTADISKLFYKFTDDRHGLKIYNTFSMKDSLQLFSTLQDSLGIVARDSFYIKFPESSRKPDEFKVTGSETVASEKRKNILGDIKFDKPLKKIILDSIAIRRDSLEQYFVYKSTSFEFDTLENILHYTIEIPQEILDSLKTKKQKQANLIKGKKGKKGSAKYELYIPAAAFISIEDDSSAHISKPLKFINPEQTGLIKGKITTELSSFIIQLLDTKFNLIKEQYGGVTYLFNEIPPGEYLIRIILDENENGKWDPGDIRLNQLPEKVIIYKDETGNNKTSIRANWEVTIDLIF